MALAVREWIARRGFKTLFIKPGSPCGRTPPAKAFSCRFRDEFLNREAFASVLEAKVLGKEHRQRHNHERPHSSLDYQTPVEFAQRTAPQRRTALRLPPLRSGSRKAALFPPTTSPPTQPPKTNQNSHSKWIKNRGQATALRSKAELSG